MVYGTRDESEAEAIAGQKVRARVQIPDPKLKPGGCGGPLTILVCSKQRQGIPQRNLVSQTSSNDELRFQGETSIL